MPRIVSGSKLVKGIRKSLFRLAQIYIGYYHPSTPVFTYRDNDLHVDILFGTFDASLRFQTEFESIGTQVSFSQVETKSEITALNNVNLSSRIFLKHYSSVETDSPEDSFFSRTEIFTQYQPTDDMVKYQSIENADFLQFGSEGAHLIPSHICKKIKSIVGWIQVRIIDWLCREIFMGILMD